VIKKLKHITISEANYLTLKTLGNAGDSFNDVVTGVLKKMGSVLQFDSEVGVLQVICDFYIPSFSAAIITLYGLLLLLVINLLQGFLNLSFGF